MTATGVVLRAPAKLTVSLRITGVRPDGYHEIDAEMVTLDLADQLRVLPGDRSRVRYIGPRPLDVAPESDLVLLALREVGRTAAVEVHKRIRAGAGLGGGSSDAAAVLRWAGWRDPARAVALGADVAFCVVGGRARVRGIGEHVEPLDHRDEEFTLVTPPFGCSTPAVYAAWDELGGPSADGPNDLEAPALAVVPDLARVRDELGEATGQSPQLAGSGSTWFVRGSHPGPGRVVVRTVPAEAQDQPSGADFSDS